MKKQYIKPTSTFDAMHTEHLMLTVSLRYKNNQHYINLSNGGEADEENVPEDGGNAKHFNAWDNWD